MSKVYEVNFIEKDQLVISGRGDDESWRKADMMEDFNAFWSDQIGSTTCFKALCNEHYLYFCFRIRGDADLFIDESDNTINEIGNSDRVELFFRIDNRMKPYYCLEIDPRGRVMDFKAMPDRIFDFDWRWPKEHLEILTEVSDEGYTVEGAFSMTSLKALSLVSNDIIETGLYRAKYVELIDGSRQPVWISWVNPETELPDFHTSTSFGYLHLNTHKNRSILNEY